MADEEDDYPDSADDEYIEIDSPMEPAADVADEDDELLDGANALGQPLIASPSTSSSSRLNKAKARMVQREDRTKMMDWPDSLPYQCETLHEFDERMAFVHAKLVECVTTRDYDVGIVQWNHKLQCLLSLHYPMARATRAALADLFYHLVLTPGLDVRTLELAARTAMTLLAPKRRISLRDLTLPWKPLYHLLRKQLYPKARATGITSLYDCLIDLARVAQRFYSPHETDAVLDAILPDLNGSVINSVVTNVASLTHFLPLSQPQRWLPAVCKIWRSFESSLVDDLFLELLARISEMHSNPYLSLDDGGGEGATMAGDNDSPVTAAHSSTNPSSATTASATTASATTASATTASTTTASATTASTNPSSPSPPGLWKDVGLLTRDQFALVMTKALRGAGLPVGASKDANAALMAQSAGISVGADAAVDATVLRMLKRADRISSLATIIVYCMSADGPVTPTEQPDSGTSTPSSSASSVSNEQPHFLAGSRALDALARLLQATETYFHPSNWGPWQYTLSALVSDLTRVFYTRWIDERKVTSKVPPERQLTPAIKKEFVSATRTVCLLSMFGKDPFTMGATQVALRRLALLEPEQIIPAFLDRAYPALEELETTQRTTAILSAMSALAMPIVSRNNFAAGGKHLVPLLYLCLPAFDPTDTTKTMFACAFVISSLLTVRVDDLTRPELIGNGGSDSTEANEEDDALKLSTAGFQEWIHEYFKRVFVLLESLPEEGTKGRIGGKQEEGMITSLCSATDALVAALHPGWHQEVFDIVFKYCSQTGNASANRAVGSIIATFTRVNPTMVLSKVIPMVDRRIRSEIEHGASSVRTTSTHKPLQSDTTLHWHLSCLIGALSYAGAALLDHKDTLLSLIQLLVARTRTERGYSLTSGLVSRVITTLCSIYPSEYHFLNPDEWTDPALDGKSHLLWGKMYEARDVKLSWHLPSDGEVDFVVDIFKKVVEPALDEIEAMQSVEIGQRDKVWSNDFCRKLQLVRMGFRAQANLVQDPELGGGEAVSDAGEECMEFIRPPPRFRSGFILTDEGDERHKYIVAFRQRVGQVLYRCATSTTAEAAEDKQDCIKLLLRAVRGYMTDYSYFKDDYDHHAYALQFYRKLCKVHPRQKEEPRVLWARRAAFYHASRARLNAFHRRRSALDDRMIKDVLLEFCMSSYVSVRKTAQHTLDTVASLYDGARQICISTLIKTVASSRGVGDDRVKGALYCLGGKGFSAMAITDPRFAADYILCLINAQHHPKPSLQKLIRGILGDFCQRFAEPSTLKYRLETPQELLTKMQEYSAVASPPLPSSPPEVLEGVTAARISRAKMTDALHARLVPELLRIAQAPHTHWSFAQYSARILRSLIRKDQPLSPDVAAYFAGQLLADNPMMRKYATGAVSRILYYYKVRTLAANDTDLVLAKTTNTLKRKRTLDVPVSDEFRRRTFESFFEPVDEAAPEYIDSQTLGWLAWGKEQWYYTLPAKGHPSYDWDTTSQPAMDALWDVVSREGFWTRYFNLLAQEKRRDQPAIENSSLLKGFTQVYGTRMLAAVAPVVDELIGEKDRHKHRAASEGVIGLLRGRKCWPLDWQAEFWAWFTPLLPRIFKESTQDSAPVWEEVIAQAFDGRDPRRSVPVHEFVLGKVRRYLAGDDEVESLSLQIRAHGMLRSIIATLDRKFNARAGEFAEAYTARFDSAFTEIRHLQSENLTDMELFGVAPEYGSVRAFVEAANAEARSQVAAEAASTSNSDSDAAYAARFARLRTKLAECKAHRVPTSQGQSTYDSASSTALLWLTTTLGDHRVSGIAPHAIEFLPHIFEMLELKDNSELSRLARAALTAICTHHYGAGPLPGKLVRQLTSIIAQSTDSWRVRLDALPILQVAFFQNLFYLGPADVRDIVDVLLSLLKDVHPEVREMVATSLSGVVRCSPRRLITDLKSRFTSIVVRSAVLPPRGSPAYAPALIELHSGILGATALLNAFPYDVPPWMPSLLLETVCQHTDDPPPISTTIKKCAKEWKRTHQDNWKEAQLAFEPEQLAEVNAWALGRSDYYA